MIVYHTYESKNGFNLNSYNFDRGLFTTKAWWVNNPKFPKYKNLTAFHPNEFGDKTVELDIDESVKTFKAMEQLDVLEKFFPDNLVVKKIIEKYETGEFGREDFQKMDIFIGKFLKKSGYKIIHYTHDQMYGNTWAILDKSIIRKYRFEDIK